jgi:hypothetical protein
VLAAFGRALGQGTMNNRTLGNERSVFLLERHSRRHRSLENSLRPFYF